MVTFNAQNRLFLGPETTNWLSLVGRAEKALGDPETYDNHRVMVVVEDMAQALSSLAYGLIHDLDWGVIEGPRLSPEIAAHLGAAGVRLVDYSTGLKHGTGLCSAGPTADTASLRGRITVMTSGTTGMPKLIAHNKETLNTFDRVRDLPPNCWFLPYQIGSYAWYQMAMMGLFVAGQDLSPGDFTDLSASFEKALLSGHVTAISSTPTFWRHALMETSDELIAAAALRSITLGGEIVDQAILDRLAALFPNAVIRHIYASSEAGAAIVVSDGRAGFSCDVLSRTTGSVDVKIEEGRLFIRSPYGNSTASGQWIDTGDLVNQRNGRVYFCGRADNSMINVGGQKAFPADIEAHLLTHADVVWAKVSARRAPLVGYLPVAAIVLKHPVDSNTAETMLTQYCMGRLADYAIPRIWSFLESVPMRPSLKS